MSEQRRIEGDEPESDETSTAAEHFPCGQEDDQGQQDGDRRGCEANAEQDRVGVIAEQKVSASSRFLKPVRAVLKGRHSQLHIQQRKGAEKLDQRRVLGVEPEVVMLR